MTRGSESTLLLRYARCPAQDLSKLSRLRCCLSAQPLREAAPRAFATSEPLEFILSLVSTERPSTPLLALGLYSSGLLFATATY